MGGGRKKHMAAFSLLHPLCLPRMHSFCKEVHSPGVGIFFHYGCICIHYYIFFLLFLSQKLKGKLCFPSFPIIQVNNMSSLWKLSSLKMEPVYSVSAPVAEGFALYSAKRTL